MKLSPFMLAVLAAGCDRTPGEGPRRSADEQDKSGTTKLTSAGYVNTAAAVDRLVAARCARELTCGNVGPDKGIVSTDVCVGDTRKDVQAGYGASECPGGMDAPKLDACLDAVRREPCDRSVTPLSNLRECRLSEMCVH